MDKCACECGCNFLLFPGERTLCNLCRDMKWHKFDRNPMDRDDDEG